MKTNTVFNLTMSKSKNAPCLWENTTTGQWHNTSKIIVSKDGNRPYSLHISKDKEYSLIPVHRGMYIIYTDNFQGQTSTSVFKIVNVDKEKLVVECENIKLKDAELGFLKEAIDFCIQKSIKYPDVKLLYSELRRK